MSDSPNPKPLDCDPSASAPAQRQSPAGFVLSAHSVEALKALAAKQHLELGRGTSVQGHQGQELSVRILETTLKARTNTPALSPAMVPDPSGLLSYVYTCAHMHMHTGVYLCILPCVVGSVCEVSFTPPPTL